MDVLSELTLHLSVWLHVAGQRARDVGRRTLTLERGQGMVEYGIILALIAVAAIAVLVLLGPQVKGMFQDTLDQVKGARTPTP